ncbi:type I-E CRISPR-associated protein Cse1/CasA [Haloferula chungangensis]|uniref:Type I-E CRISPR-associated protein Cse1/CasA n=1 Tax=Haloferula chungangensis TaxID=1048331 RepID=A0ABW2LAP9_9BACT
MNFNLILDPWISVACGNCTKLLSLNETFARAAEITDLAMPPHERISILRLLLCISQAALDEHLDYDDAIPGLREKLSASAIPYLDQWQPAFELFGDGQRFLQGLSKKHGTMRASKLDLHLSTGNNSTLLDHRNLNSREIGFDRLATTLISFQNFAPAMGGYEGLGPAVARDMRHCFLHGRSLLETLNLNLLSYENLSNWTGEGMGRPIWENMTELLDYRSEALRNARSTYLGRLCPFTREIWIQSPTCILIASNDSGLPKPPEIIEPSASSLLVKKSNGSETTELRSINPSRSVWRELDAILAQGEGAKRPLYFENARTFGLQAVAVWSGGLSTDKGAVKTASSSLFAGEISIPSKFFDGPPEYLVRYRGAIKAASVWADAIGKATAEFAWRLQSSEADKAKKRKKPKDPFKAPAQADFWNRLEQHLPILYNFALDPTKSISDKPDTLGFAYNSENPYNPSAWHQLAGRLARECYRRTCDPDRSRNLIAYVQGESQLWPKNPQKKEIEAYKKELKNTTAA